MRKNTLIKNVMLLQVIKITVQ